MTAVMSPKFLPPPCRITYRGALHRWPRTDGSGPCVPSLFRGARDGGEPAPQRELPGRLADPSSREPEPSLVLLDGLCEPPGLQPRRLGPVGKLEVSERGRAARFATAVSRRPALGSVAENQLDHRPRRSSTRRLPRCRRLPRPGPPAKPRSARTRPRPHAASPGPRRGRAEGWRAHGTGPRAARPDRRR